MQKQINQNGALELIGIVIALLLFLLLVGFYVVSPALIHKLRADVKLSDNSRSEVVAQFQIAAELTRLHEESALTRLALQQYQRQFQQFALNYDWNARLPVKIQCKK